MSKLFILDNGHGGLVDGHYVTPGKRSPDFGDGVYFEGVGNREIVSRIAQGLSKLGIDHHILVPEQEDISLQERVQRANGIHRKHGNTMLTSVHSDAFKNPEANGWATWTSRGYTPADSFAEIFYEEAELILCSRTIRKDKSDGDNDYEAGFYMCTKTEMPSVLTENGFMTNLQDYRLLMSEGGKNLIAQLHINAIRRINYLP